jgi:hypothetical protein
MTDLQVGDVALDLTQGRPVHIIEDTGLDAATWSERNDYELTDNYGNDRMGAAPDDRVFEVVYCSSLKSEPSKTYAMPSARLARVETEAADDGAPVADRIRQDLLADLLAEARRLEADGIAEAIEAIAAAVTDEETVGIARELADVEQTIGGEADD